MLAQLSLTTRRSLQHKIIFTGAISVHLQFNTNCCDTPLPIANKLYMQYECRRLYMCICMRVRERKGAHEAYSCKKVQTFAHSTAK